MPNNNPILLGAVAYDPKVVTIWEGIREHFQEQDVPMDFALFSNYERQVEELLKGHIDIAWNTPLAHVRVRQRTGNESLSLGMRDSDRDFRAKVIVRRGRDIELLKDIEGKSLAVGSADSTQARIVRDALGQSAASKTARVGRPARMVTAARRRLPQS